MQQIDKDGKGSDRNSGDSFPQAGHILSSAVTLSRTSPFVSISRDDLERSVQVLSSIPSLDIDMKVQVLPGDVKTTGIESNNVVSSVSRRETPASSYSPSSLDMVSAASGNEHSKAIGSFDVTAPTTTATSYPLSAVKGGSGGGGKNGCGVDNELIIFSTSTADEFMGTAADILAGPLRNHKIKSAKKPRGVRTDGQPAHGKAYLKYSSVDWRSLSEEELSGHPHCSIGVSALSSGKFEVKFCTSKGTSTYIGVFDTWLQATAASAAAHTRLGLPLVSRFKKKGNSTMKSPSPSISAITLEKKQKKKNGSGIQGTATREVGVPDLGTTVASINQSQIQAEEEEEGKEDEKTELEHHIQEIISSYGKGACSKDSSVDWSALSEAELLEYPQSTVGVNKLPSGRYQVKFTVDGKLKNFGCFGTYLQATAACAAARLRHSLPLERGKPRSSVPYRKTAKGEVEESVPSDEQEEEDRGSSPTLAEEDGNCSSDQTTPTQVAIVEQQVGGEAYMGGESSSPIDWASLSEQDLLAYPHSSVGVCKVSNSDRYQVKIMVNGKITYFGSFDTYLQATAACADARLRLGVPLDRKKGGLPKRPLKNSLHQKENKSSGVDFEDVRSSKASTGNLTRAAMDVVEENGEESRGAPSAAAPPPANPSSDQGTTSIVQTTNPVERVAGNEAGTNLGGDSSRPIDWNSMTDEELRGYPQCSLGVYRLPPSSSQGYRYRVNFTVKGKLEYFGKFYTFLQASAACASTRLRLGLSLERRKCGRRRSLALITGGEEDRFADDLAAVHCKEDTTTHLLGNDDGTDVDTDVTEVASDYSGDGPDGEDHRAPYDATAAPKARGCKAVPGMRKSTKTPSDPSRADLVLGRRAQSKNDAVATMAPPVPVRATSPSPSIDWRSLSEEELRDYPQCSLGVCKTPAGRYSCNFSFRSRAIYLGTFDTFLQASAACAAERLQHGLPLERRKPGTHERSNVSRPHSTQMTADTTADEGVAIFGEGNNWTASVIRRGVRVFLGVFTSKLEAEEAFKEAIEEDTKSGLRKKIGSVGTVRRRFVEDDLDSWSSDGDGGDEVEEEEDGDDDDDSEWSGGHASTHAKDQKSRKSKRPRTHEGVVLGQNAQASQSVYSDIDWKSLSEEELQEYPQCPFGVYRLPSGRCTVQFVVNGKYKYFGCFDTFLQATAACAAARLFHGLSLERTKRGVHSRAASSVTKARPPSMKNKPIQKKLQRYPNLKKGTKLSIVDRNSNSTSGSALVSNRSVASSEPLSSAFNWNSLSEDQLRDYPHCPQGVYKMPTSSRYQVMVYANRKSTFVGTFDTYRQATAASAAARLRHGLSLEEGDRRAKGMPKKSSTTASVSTKKTENSRSIDCQQQRQQQREGDGIQSAEHSGSKQGEEETSSLRTSASEPVNEEGVSRFGDGHKWTASIVRRGVRVFLGIFSSKSEAERTFKQAIEEDAKRGLRLIDEILVRRDEAAQGNKEGEELGEEDEEDFWESYGDEADTIDEDVDDDSNSDGEKSSEAVEEEQDEKVENEGDTEDIGAADDDKEDGNHADDTRNKEDGDSTWFSDDDDDVCVRKPLKRLRKSDGSTISHTCIDDVSHHSPIDWDSLTIKELSGYPQSSTGVYKLPSGRYSVQLSVKGKTVHFGKYNSHLRACVVCADARNRHGLPERNIINEPCDSSISISASAGVTRSSSPPPLAERSHAAARGVEKRAGKTTVNQGRLVVKSSIVPDRERLPAAPVHTKKPSSIMPDWKYMSGDELLEYPQCSRGVYNLPHGRYEVRFFVNGKTEHFGTFDTFLQAATACAAERRRLKLSPEPRRVVKSAESTAFARSLAPAHSSRDDAVNNAGEGDLRPALKIPKRRTSSTDSLPGDGARRSSAALKPLSSSSLKRSAATADSLSNGGRSKRGRHEDRFTAAASRSLPFSSSKIAAATADSLSDDGRSKRGRQEDRTTAAPPAAARPADDSEDAAVTSSNSSWQKLSLHRVGTQASLVSPPTVPLPSRPPSNHVISQTDRTHTTPSNRSTSSHAHGNAPSSSIVPPSLSRSNVSSSSVTSHQAQANPARQRSVADTPHHQCARSAAPLLQSPSSRMPSGGFTIVPDNRESRASVPTDKATPNTDAPPASNNPLTVTPNTVPPPASSNPLTVTPNTVPPPARFNPLTVGGILTELEMYTHSDPASPSATKITITMDAFNRLKAVLGPAKFTAFFAAQPVRENGLHPRKKFSRLAAAAGQEEEIGITFLFSNFVDGLAVALHR